MYIISACLLGENCRYSGGNNNCQWVQEFAEAHSYIPVCPEIRAGLPCPRPPAEISGGRVIDKEGSDLTEHFIAGAQLCYEDALKASQEADEKLEGAILKANSPSCGCGIIYDGTFSGRQINGDGFFAGLLKQKQIKVITEKENISW